MLRINQIRLTFILLLSAALSACGGGGGGEVSSSTPPVFTSGATISVVENTTTTGYTAVATDADGDTVTFSLTGGTDQAVFAIDAASGVLSFNTAADFEIPTDSDSNNSYVVEITATDGTSTVVQSVIVTVTDVNEAPPVFTSGTAISVAENTATTGYTAVATDADGDTVTFSLSGGTDQAAFSIDNNSGVLSFTTAPDFEVPADNDSNNTYVVEITATDGINLVAQNITVTVTDIFEVTVSTADIKTIQFDWLAFSGATNYKLFVNPDGASGFTLLQDNLIGTSTTIELPVHLTDWINASYILEVHDGAGKLTESPPISITTLMISSIGYAKASNTGGNDQFGYAISLSADGNTLAVGARNEDSNATGISTDGSGEASNTALDSGAVYVFSRSGSSWSQQAYVKASNAGTGDNFGYAISLSADGNTLAVGAYGEGSNATGINGDQTDNSAPSSGAVYLFSYDGTNWSQQAYVKASNAGESDVFGIAVSLSTDGNTLAVGAYLEDSNATGVSADGTDNTAADSGAVYVFSRSGSSWTQQAYVKASNTGAGDSFGIAVSLSVDGNTLAVGARNENSNATGISTDGTGEADNTAFDSGAVYVFSRSGSIWIQQAYVKASNTGAGDNFGHAVSLSIDGNTLVTGARSEDSNATDISTDGTGEADNSASNSGAVYVFSRSGSTWIQQAYVKASNTGAGDNFGHAVSLSIDGNTLAVGALYEGSNTTGISTDGTGETNNTMTNSGAVYLFSHSSSNWIQQAYVKASNTEASDLFGWNISLSTDGNTLVVGALFEDSNATGIGGNQADNSASFAGAVYLY